MMAAHTKIRPMPSASRHILRRGRLILAASLMALAATGCSNVARRDIEQARLEAHTAPLELSGREGTARAVIDADGSVSIGKAPLSLDRQQRAATLAYREAYLEIVDYSLRAASKVTRFAVPRVLFGMIVHGADQAGRGIEKDAEAIPHTPGFCKRLARLMTAQDVAVSQVAALQPYANVTAHDLDSCRSGKPYRLAI
jgi:hypothetical protein